MTNGFNFLIYKTPDKDVKVNAVIKDDTIWLTQKSMAELFGCSSDNISLHLKNIFEAGELEKDSVNVNIILLAQKTVPIILKLSDNSESGVNYTMSQNTVTIKGKKDIVDSINNIETQPVKLSEILPGTSKDIYLQVPSGITIETKYITINKNSEENTLEEYTYTAKDIEIRNNTENIDKSKIKIPNSINVSIEYLQSEGSINKDDIKLYIDLNEVSLEDNTCKIKYESIYEIEKINIDPDTVTIEES